MPQTDWTFLEDLTGSLPQLDVATCDPGLLAGYPVGSLAEFPAIAARRDLPPEIQTLLSPRASGSLLSYSSARDEKPGRMASQALLTNPTWSELALVEVARHLPQAYSRSEGFFGAALLLAHPQVSEKAVLAGICALTINNTYYLRAYPEEVRRALLLLGSFSQRALVASALGRKIHARYPQETILSLKLPATLFDALVSHVLASLGSASAVEIWASLQDGFEGSDEELRALSGLLSLETVPA